MPGIDDVLRAEAERLAGVFDRINGAALVERTLALLRLGLDIAERYGRAKRRRAALDYDDLIVATRRLLEGAASAAWVLYKLDGGIDHVLVDEAQDTNPDQWEVIRRLTEEFFVGQGAVERRRTVFAVGDTKQSIFGFQRADPRKLEEMREWFAEQSRLAEQRFVPVDLNVSFRSTPAVLDAVDWVFGELEAARGVAEPGRMSHLPSRKDEPGRVELWPLVSAPEAEIDTTDLEGPQGALALPHERLARLIAIHAKGLIGKERRARKGELLHAGHFMVLVRRRNEFVNALVRALKREGIEVAGVDRLESRPGTRHPGPARPGALRAAAAGRPQPRLPAEIAADRPRRGAISSTLPGSARATSGARCANARPRRRLRQRMSGSPPGCGAPTTSRRSISLPRRSVPKAAACACWSGWGAKRPIRSTSCWRGRCSTSGPRAARCKGSCTGSRRAAARSSATSTRTAAARCAS